MLVLRCNRRQKHNAHILVSMKLMLFILFSISLPVPLSAESFFSSQLKVKGLVDEDVFESLDIKIEKMENLVNVKKKKGVLFDWDLRNDFDSILDYAYSCEYSSLVLYVVVLEKDRLKEKMIFLDGENDPQIKETPSKIDEDYDRMQGLGAVSASGKYLLARCSMRLFQKGGAITFNYQWVILEFSQNSFEVVEDELTFSKWSTYMKK